MAAGWLVLVLKKERRCRVTHISLAKITPACYTNTLKIPDARDPWEGNPNLAPPVFAP